MKRSFLKLNSLLLSLAIVFSIIVLPATAITVTKLSGSGTAADPYQIGSADELAFMRDKVNEGNATYVSAYYKLTDDIYLNDVADYTAWSKTKSPQNTWTPIGGSSSNPFKGNFDGNGHYIFGMYVKLEKSGVSFAGLFGYIKGSSSNRASVKNVNLVQSYIYAYNTATSGNTHVQLGGFAGYAEYTDFENCTNGATVYGGGDKSHNNGACGGIVGRASNSCIITKCANAGDITYVTGTGAADYNNRLGGIVGCAADTFTITECYNSGTVTGIGKVGKIAGIVGQAVRTNTGEISNCYNSGIISGDCTEKNNAMFAGIVGYSGNSTPVSNCFNVGTIQADAGLTLVGDIYGQKGSIVLSDCYYPAASTLATQTGATAVEMVSENMTSLSDTVWNLTAGTVPTLKNVVCNLPLEVLGAQIRRSYTVYYQNGEVIARGQGLRFGVTLNMQTMIQEGDLNDGYKLGLLISRAEALNNAPLTATNAQYNVPAVNSISYDSKTGSISFSGYIVGLSAEQFADEFIARAYLKKGDQVLFYSDPITRSVTSVAAEAGYVLDEMGNTKRLITSYQIVYPSGSTDLKYAAEIMQQTILEKSGLTVSVVSDAIAKNTVIPEILVGLTNRTGAGADSQWQDHTVQYSVDSEDIQILGKTDYDTFRGATSFVSDYISENGAVNTVDMPKMQSLRTADTQITAMSFNVLCWVSDEDPFENRAKRVDLVVEAILSKMPDSFGLQECSIHWIDLLEDSKELMKYYSWVGEMNESDKFNYNAVFYRKDKYECIETKTLWLSDTPEVKYSNYSTTDQSRMVTYAVLKNKTTGEIYTHYNTHLSIDREAMRKQLVVLKQITDSCKTPFVLTGDLNVRDTWQEYSSTIKVDWTDARLVANQTTDKLTDLVCILDYCLISDGIYVKTFDVMDSYLLKGEWSPENTGGYSYYLSDHYPIYIQFYLYE